MSKHIAIIMDGNRRYAKKHNLPLIHGHKKGADKLKEVLKWCKEFKVDELTLYTFNVKFYYAKIGEVKKLNIITLFGS